MVTIPPTAGKPPAPPAGAGPVTGTPQQPPFGSSPATGPTPNRGFEAQGIQKVAVIVQQMAEAIPLVGPTSEAGMALADAMRKLAKLVPPGAVTPAAMHNSMQATMLRQAQMGQQIARMRQMAAQQGAQPGAQPAAA